MTTRELLYQIEYALAAEVITLDDEVILVGAGNRKSGYIADIVTPTLIMNSKTMIPSYDELGSYHIGFTSTPE